MPSSVDKNLDQPSVNLHTNEFASIVFAVRIALDLATTLTSITWATPSVLVESPSISPLSHRTMKPALLNFLRQRTKVELQICFRQVWQQPCRVFTVLMIRLMYVLGSRSSSWGRRDIYYSKGDRRHRAQADVRVVSSGITRSCR